VNFKFRFAAIALQTACGPPPCPSPERQLHQFSQTMGLQVTQVAACNRLLEVDERLARWLRMSAERIGSNSVPLTQRFLAPMLGTRRSSVTPIGNRAHLPSREVPGLRFPPAGTGARVAHQFASSWWMITMCFGNCHIPPWIEARNCRSLIESRTA
jgi:hypothetical protein